ncbi:hypothetical protein BM451_12185 [Dickeya dadantii]|nr:hypothetical protein BM451_12185 [Dickeya dadantii]
MSFTCSLAVDHSPVTKLHLTWHYEIGIIEWLDDMQAIFQAAGVLFVLAVTYLGKSLGIYRLWLPAT